MKPEHHSDPPAGLVQGGLGGDEDQLLETGQEEVFARAEVEAGRIEHAVSAGGHQGVDPADGPEATPPAPRDLAVSEEPTESPASLLRGEGDEKDKGGQDDPEPESHRVHGM